MVSFSRRLYSTSLWCYTFLLVGLVTAEDWTPPKQPKIYRSGEVTNFHTHSRDDYRQVWLHVEDRTSVTFKVRACDEANILLSEIASGDQQAFQNIRLGAEKNTQTTLVSDAGENLASYSTPDVLNCDDYELYYVDWRSEYVILGKGWEIGKDVLLSYWEPEWNLKVLYVGFTSNTEEGADWQVRENSGSKLHFFSTAQSDYQTFWKGVSSRVSTTFKVKACSDAHILLTSQPGSIAGDVYEIVLGAQSNAENFIRVKAFSDAVADIKTQRRAMTLTCDDYRDFWISWKAGYIQIGQGSLYGSRVLMSWLDPDPLTIREISFTSSGAGEVEWLTENSLESMTTFKTHQAKPDPTHWLEVPQEEFMTFSVTACQQVSILLSDSEGMDPDYTFVIDLFALQDDGSQSRISGLRGQFGIGYIVSSPTPGELNCETSREYWVSWHNMFLQIGRGKAYGMDLVFEGFQLPPERPFQVMGFSSPSVGDAVWYLPETSGHQIRFKTESTLGNKFEFNTWNTVETKRSLQFAALANHSAQIALSPTAGLGSMDFYLLITLQDATGTSSIALVDTTGTTTLHAVKITDVICAESMHDFWVSWGNGMIQVGRGAVVGTGAFLGARDELLLRITAVSFGTPEGVEGTWILPEDPGDVVALETLGGENSWDHWLEVADGLDWITFTVRACEDVRLLVGSVMLDEQAIAIEIILEQYGNQSTIKTIENGAIVATSNSEEKQLSCTDSREFWLSWRDGNIQIGRGILFRQSMPIIEWRDPNPFTVNGVSFTTGSGQHGIWTWRDNVVPKGHFVTVYGELMTRSFTRTLEHVRYFDFGVRACTPIRVTLSELPGVVDDRAIKIVIGDNRNSEISIMQGTRGRSVTYTYPGVLVCNETQYFTVNWGGRTVSLDVHKVDTDDFTFAFDSAQGTVVRAATYTSLPGLTALWEVPLYEAFKVPDNSSLIVPTPAPGAEESSGLSGGAIAGIIIAVLAVLLIVVIGLYVAHTQGFITLPIPSQQFHNEV